MNIVCYLLDIIQTLLLSPQLDCYWVGHNVLREVHHRLYYVKMTFTTLLLKTSSNFYLIISSREKQHLAIGSKVLVDSDTLVLVSLKIRDKSIFVSKSIITNLHQRTNLCCDHDVSLVEDEDSNLVLIKEPEFETPVKHLDF